MKNRIWILAALGVIIVSVSGCGLVQQRVQRFNQKENVCVDFEEGVVLDGNYYAALDLKTFNGERMYVDLYEPVCFDTLSISQMEVGDVFGVNGKGYAIKGIEYDNGNIRIIGGGISFDLRKDGEDQYVLYDETNMPKYEKVLSGPFKFDDNFCLIGENVLVGEPNSIKECFGDCCDVVNATIQIKDGVISAIMCDELDDMNDEEEPELFDYVISDVYGLNA